MPKTKPIKPKDLAKAIIKLGFYKHHQVGSHAVYKHADGRRTTIPIHNRELKRGLLHGILNDMKLTREDLDNGKNLPRIQSELKKVRKNL